MSGSPQSPQIATNSQTVDTVKLCDLFPVNCFNGGRRLKGAVLGWHHHGKACQHRSSQQQPIHLAAAEAPLAHSLQLPLRSGAAPAEPASGMVAEERGVWAWLPARPGSFLAWLQHHGWAMVGFTPSPVAAASLPSTPLGNTSIASRVLQQAQMQQGQEQQQQAQHSAVAAGLANWAQQAPDTDKQYVSTLLGSDSLTDTAAMPHLTIDEVASPPGATSGTAAAASKLQPADAVLPAVQAADSVTLLASNAAAAAPGSGSSTTGSEATTGAPGHMRRAARKLLDGRPAAVTSSSAPASRRLQEGGGSAKQPYYATGDESQSLQKWSAGASTEDQQYLTMLLGQEAAQPDSGSVKLAQLQPDGSAAPAPRRVARMLLQSHGSNISPRPSNTGSAAGGRQSAAGDAQRQGLEAWKQHASRQDAQYLDQLLQPGSGTVTLQDVQQASGGNSGKPGN